VWPLFVSIMFTDSVKAINQSLTLEVLGLPFGTDRQGQVFDANTNIGLQPGDAVPAFYWHGYAERNDGAVKSIGRAIYERVDAAGHWFKVQLDDASDAALKIYEDAKAGNARASSDSSSHLVRPFGIVGKPGYVSNWPIFAMSLMDSTTASTAVNPRAIAMAAAKALIDESSDEGSADDMAGEATKAGATFAMRNRERIKALQKLLDEMKAEFPVAEIEATPADADTVATKGDKVIMENEIEVKDTVATPAGVAVEAKDKGVDIEAVKAELRAEFEGKLAESNRLKFASVNVNTNAAKAEEVAAKAQKDAWLHYVRTGESGQYIEAAKATMNRTTAGQGGYLPPIKYSNELVQAMTEGSKIRQLSRNITVEGANSFKVPGLTNSTAAVLSVESTAYTQLEPTITEVSFDPYKYTHLSLATDELLADSRIDVYGQILQPDAVNSFTLAENTAFATGTGSSQPQGLFVGASFGVTAAGTNAITAEEVIDLYHSVALEYRERSTWVMNDSTLKLIRKMRESGSTTGAFLWQPSMIAGQPDTILGRPVVTISTAPAATTGLKPIVFGDLSYFWVCDFDSGNAGFKRLEERYAELGQVGFRWSKRIDSNVMLAAAIKHLVMA
jgi:HK97 family phage major capsid protein